MRTTLCPCLLGLLFTVALSVTAGEAGRVNFFKRGEPAFDAYTGNPTASQQEWMRTHFWRFETFSPYFDNKLSWMPQAWLYFDAYAIYVDSELSRLHPDWILKDAAGNLLYIQWLSEDGLCWQYAADTSNLNFRRWWIDHGKALMAKGYRGLWIDDVNLLLRVSDRYGKTVTPIDPNTGIAMTEAVWNRYMADFMEQVRRELPTIEIVHNSIWFAGHPDNNPDVRRQVLAADWINIERGVNDSGLTGGTGQWSLHAVLSFCDQVHALGRGVVIDGTNDVDDQPVGREFAAACYFLISNGNDGLGNPRSTPDNWWPGYDVNLGTPSGPRYSWNGLLRRDFSGGMVLVNEPGALTKTVTLPQAFKKVDGTSVSSVSLAARQGAVLLGTVTPPPPPTGEVYLSDLNWSYMSNGWGPAEKDKSNGEAGTGDGRTITLNGVTYAKGLGVHASSDVRYALQGGYTRFISDVGVDDESGAWGTIVFQVWADGLKLYDSGVMNASSATKRVDVDLTGKNELRLIALDGGDGIGSDHGDWASARLRAAVSDVYLSDLPWLSASGGWGPVEKDKSNGEQNAGDGRTLTLNGVTYPKGLGVHAPSEIRYALGGKYALFLSDVGVDDESGSYGSVVFQVWLDGVKAYDSGSMTATATTKTVALDVSGKNELRLVVTDGGDGVGSDHADWAGARLIAAGSGLKGEYFDNIDFTALKTTRTDASVNFDWGGGAPESVIATDTFSVRWSGQVLAKRSEIYTFYTLSDDGVRLWVNGQLLVNNWTDHAPTENSARITLAAGRKYDLKLEYFENGGGAVAKLSWSSATQPKQIIPQSFLFPLSSSSPVTGVVAAAPAGEVVASSVSVYAQPSSAALGQEIAFTIGGVEGVEGVEYSWDFGEGTTGSGATVTHVFSAAGSYQVKVSGATGAVLGAVMVTVVVPRQPESVEQSVDLGRVRAGERFRLDLPLPVSGKEARGLKSTLVGELPKGTRLSRTRIGGKVAEPGQYRFEVVFAGKAQALRRIYLLVVEP